MAKLHHENALPRSYAASLGLLLPLHQINLTPASEAPIVNDDIAFSPTETDLTPFTNTVFFDTNLGRFLDQFEEFDALEAEDGYDLDREGFLKG